MELIGTEDAAKLLGCTAQYIRKGQKQGKVSAVKIGRDWFVDRSEVARLKSIGYGTTKKPKIAAETT